MTKEIENQIEAVKQYLIENWDNPDSAEICDILGIEKTQKIRLAVVIKGTMTVEIPLGYTTDDLNYLSAEISVDFDDNDVETLDVDLEISQIKNITDW